MTVQARVHHLVASHLHIAEAAIEDRHTFDELGLTPLDVVLVVLRLEQLERGEGQFPVAALDDARTVGELVALVDDWLAGGRPARAQPTAGATCA
jgi:acyl carrier protein